MNAQRTTLFGLLFTVSAFNLSALPTQQPTVITRTLSSVDTCDLAEQLNGSDTPSAACNITQGKLKGKLSIKRVTKTTRQWTDDSDTPKVETKPQWEVTLETECTTGCAEGTVKRLANNNVDTLRQAMDKVAEQKEIFSKEADRVTKDEREKKELAEREERCEVDKGGKEFASEDKALSCKVGRVAKMDSREKAAEYFQNEIQPQLQNLVNCNDLSGTGSMLSLMPAQNLQQTQIKCNQDRTKAVALMKKLSGTRNPYIKQALGDLDAFSQYAQYMDQLNVAARYTNDPQQKQAAQQQMQLLQQRWGSYFAMRGMAINQMSSPMDWDSSVIGYQSGLAGNLQSYNNAFSQLALQHQQMLGLNGQTTNTGVSPLAAGNGRNMRGQVSTQYGNAPQAPALATAAQLQPQPVPQQQMPQPLGANRAGGTPNIIKPSLGSSVR